MSTKSRSRSRYLFGLTLAGIAGLYLVWSGALWAQPSKANPNPGIIPPHARPHGQTYGEWSAAWWKWALETTVDDSPLLDQTGENCAEGQPRGVWFLAGTFPTPDPIVRYCVVPAGRMLFFPVANAFCSAEGTFEEMQSCAAGFMEAAIGIHAEINGITVQNLDHYRVTSPNFTLSIPEDNIFGVPAGLYEPTASDGVFLMLAPLEPGAHTIHFRATFPDGTVDVTYFLTVQP